MRQDWEAGALFELQGLIISLLARSLLDHNQNIKRSGNIVRDCLGLSCSQYCHQTWHQTLHIVLTEPANLICGHPANDLIDLLRSTFLAQFLGMFLAETCGCDRHYG